MLQFGHAPGDTLHHRCQTLVRISRYPAAIDDLIVCIDQAQGDLGAAQVDADDPILHFLPYGNVL